MTEAPRTSLQASQSGALVTESHRIEGSVDDIFRGARAAVRTTTVHASGSAHGLLERGKGSVLRVERSGRAGSEAVGRSSMASLFATALAAGAIGYAIGLLAHRSLR